MNILTKRNGVALIAVMAVLLVLTLLLPLMFTMSENAMKTAMKGTDELKASYLSRTMLEMSVAAFQQFYDEADEGSLVKPGATDALSLKRVATYEKYKEFTNTETPVAQRTATGQTVYMHQKEGTQAATMPIKPVKKDNQTEAQYAAELAEYNQAYETFKGYVTYNKNETSSEGFFLVGSADCTMVYSDETKYYKVAANGSTTLITENEYNIGIANQTASIEIGKPIPEQYSKIQTKSINFLSSATVNGKTVTRKCIMVLPTKPAEQSWIVPANFESHQIFPDVAYSSGRTTINYTEGALAVDKKAASQPLYTFSCVGNMVLTTANLKIKVTQDMHNDYLGGTAAAAKPDALGPVGGYITYEDYLNHVRLGNFLPHIKPYDISVYSLGLHPETGTREPDADPTFNCLRTYNMNSWAKDAQKDNFVAFTATNGIQVDMPVNLVLNPSRTNRIGDGLSDNSSLYKVLVFQAPNIVFKKEVNSLMSLNVEDGAYRMTTIMFAAPDNTPYSYANGSRGSQMVKAGKVFFQDDVYIWLIPFEDRGSGYKTQTVYYKNKDIILYKVANAGDVYYFNAEVPVTLNQKEETAGFSLTGYFMDVIYRNNAGKMSLNNWWNVWGNAKQALFNNLLNVTEPTYKKDDFKKIGNIYDGTYSEPVPVVDDFYVVWEN